MSRRSSRSARELAVASMSADPSLAPSLDPAAATEHETYDRVHVEEHADVAGLAQAMRSLGAAVGNLTTIQRDNNELAQRLRDVEETSTRRGDALVALRRELLERDARIAFLEVEVERLRTRAVAAANEEREDATDAAAAHLLFLAAGGGYVVEERSGPPPRQGTTVEVNGARYTVTRHGTSPLPHDARRCAYLLQIVSRGA